MGNPRKVVPLQPINIVEPFNHQRKGHTNEYKVSTNPHRALATATVWLRHNLVVTMPCSNHYHIINITGI